MVRIRLQRRGRTHRPFYRIGAVDSRTRQPGSLLENLGWYDPMAKDADKQIHLKTDRIKHWLEHGAVPSDTMMDILGRHDLLSDKMKADWEKTRAAERDRLTCRAANTRATAAREELRKLMESANADHSEALKTINASCSATLRAIDRARADSAETAASKAEAALESAKKAEASASPPPEPEPAGEASES